jgi:predicted ATPase
MITQIHIKNFKCFQQADLCLASITLLSGLNGVGKSTTLQSLLLLRQSQDGESKIRLNGDLVELGQTSDAFCETAEDDEMAFRLVDEQCLTLEWAYQFTEETFQTKKIAENTGNCILFSDHFHYISADRWGPRRFLPMSEFDVHHGKLGKYGEYTAHYLMEYGDRLFANPRLPLRDEEAGKTLLHQVQVWLNEISPGTRIETKALKEVDASTISFSFRGEYGYSKAFRPTNVGFGLSYTLPVIVALLSLPEGGLVMLENPEAHLHPRGQTIMGKLMAIAAAAGIQVIVETHSDHVLNGIRIAVRDGIIKPEDSCFHYFTRDAKGKIEIQTPLIDAEGRIDQWPEGFFDESVRNLATLSSSRRRERRKKTEDTG